MNDIGAEHHMMVIKLYGGYDEDVLTEHTMWLGDCLQFSHCQSSSQNREEDCLF